MSETATNAIDISVVAAQGRLFENRYSIEIPNWKVLDNGGTLQLERSLKPPLTDTMLAAISRDAELIFLAMFIADHYPRNILYFNHSQPVMTPDGDKLWTWFGNPMNDSQDNQVLTIQNAFMQTGSLFNAKMNGKEELASEEQILWWFNFLKQNSSVASSLSLIQEAFRQINQLYTGVRYSDYIKLASSVVSLTAGLEALFCQGSDDHADISFKFKTVGPAYYERFAQQQFLNRFTRFPSKKLSHADFKWMLGLLYGIRSTIAHGRLFEFVGDKKSIKKWAQFCSKMDFGPAHGDSVGSLCRTIITGVSLFQRHLFAMIDGAKENLTLGVRIIDRIVEESTARK